MTKPPTLESDSRPINQALYASGLQCAKRLYLDYHYPEETPAPSDAQQSMADAGLQLVELARTAFPRGIEVEAADADADAAIRRTAELLAEPRPNVLFNAAFRHDGVQIRSDIILSTGTGQLDVLEVKTSTKVKPRHVMDVALQIWALEACGYTVRSASLLHLNGQYRHDGSTTWPVHKIIKNVDVTAKARKHLERVGEQIRNFAAQLEDPVTLELPTGTWCHVPFTCVYLASCRAEGPEMPLHDLPDLSRQQEYAFHQNAVEELPQIDPRQPGLTLVQRRALRSIQTKGLIVEDWVRDELGSLPWPLHFVNIETVMEVLPRYEGTRPWQQVPFQWSDTTLHRSGTLESASWVAGDRDDPRAAFVKSLADRLGGHGSLIFWTHAPVERLREMLEDPADKADVRLLLNMAGIEMQRLVRAGVYHPGFQGSFELPVVHKSLVAGATYEDLDVTSSGEASSAWRRVLAPRTRATTISKAGAQVDAFSRRQSEAMLAIYRELMQKP